MSISDQLYAALTLPCMAQSHWKSFASALHTLASNIDDYGKYLQQKSTDMQKRHSEPMPLRTPDDGRSSNIQTIVEARARPPHLVARYKDLESALLAQKEYGDPVFINDFAPSSPRFRYKYMHELHLPFTVELYSYHHGNNLGTL